jgi:hypothetical protein
MHSLLVIPLLIFNAWFWVKQEFRIDINAHPIYPAIERALSWQLYVDFMWSDEKIQKETFLLFLIAAKTHSGIVYAS